MAPALSTLPQVPRWNLAHLQFPITSGLVSDYLMLNPFLPRRGWTFPRHLRLFSSWYGICVLQSYATRVAADQSFA